MPLGRGRESDDMKTIAIFAAAALLAMTMMTGMAAAEERMSISTDKTAYFIGEGVVITLTNEYKESVALKGYWVEDATGQAVYFPPMPLFVQYLAPGESWTYVWGQIDDSGAQVGTGFYSMNTDTDSVQIEIVNPIAVSTDGDTFTAGEGVPVSITNTAQETVFVSGGYQVLDAAGEVVYAEDALAFMQPLLPGASIQYVWAQTTDSGEQAPEGTYVITSSGSQATITIEPAAQTSPVQETHTGNPHTQDLTVDPVAARPMPPRSRPKSIL